MIKLGVLGSTKGTDLQAIIDSIEKKELIAKIAVVISNKEGRVFCLLPMLVSVPVGG